MCLLISDIQKNYNTIYCYSFKIWHCITIPFKNSKLKDVVKELGLSKIVLETDSPYLSPYRGEVNEPCNVRYICDFISEYLGISFDEVSLVTTGNACRLFDLDVYLW